MSGIGLTGLASHGRKGILGPGLTGFILSLMVGVPFCTGFLHGHRSPRDAALPASPDLSAPARVPAATATPARSRGVGVFISAPGRTDMVHDPKRNLLYIAAGDSVLRYQIASNAFLPPLVLGGKLRGVDLSPDANCLAVADGDSPDGRVGVYLVDLNAETNSRVTFPAQSLESGAYAVAFGADGAIWISSSFSGSGFVPLRKLDPRSRHWMQIGTVSQDTMLVASADRQTIGFAEANISGGEYGRIRHLASQLPPTILRANAFLYEIGISRDGTLLVVPTGQNVQLSGSTVLRIEEPRVIGVVCHPQRDYVFLACGGSSVVAVYDPRTGTKVKELDFGDRFEWAGNHAFQAGRLRLSADGAWLFCTVNDGIRYVATGLN
jgi:hypothetical protein